MEQEYCHEKLMKSVLESWHTTQYRPWENAIKPIRMSPNSYYIGGSWVGVILINTGAGLILIDSGMPGQLYLIFEGIRELGFNPKDIKIALISHGHFDHCGSMKAVIEYTGAKLYAPKEDLPAIEGDLETLHARGAFYTSAKPDFFYNNNKLINLGKITISTLHTPGHTDGNTAFFFDDFDDYGNRLRAGIIGGVGLNTLIPDNPKQDMKPFLLRRKAYRKSMEKLMEQHVDITVPIHPSTVNTTIRSYTEGSKGNSYHSPMIWKDTIAKYLKRLDLIENNSL